MVVGVATLVSANLGQTVQVVKIPQVNYGENSHNHFLIVYHLSNVEEGAVLSLGTLHSFGSSSEFSSARECSRGPLYVTASTEAVTSWIRWLIHHHTVLEQPSDAQTLASSPMEHV